MTLTASDLAIQYITSTNGSSRILENSTATSTASNLTLSGVDGNGNLINLIPAFGTPLSFTIRNGSTSALNLILGASGNFNAASGATLLIGSAISQTGGAQSMTKTGAGTLTLTGANTYTGITGVTAGTLNLGNGTSGSLSSSSMLAVGGNGIFNFTGAAAATQTVNGLNVNAGYGTVNNTVTGTTLTLGGITRSGSGMVGFATTTGNINTSTTNDATGIIGTWATRGTTSNLGYAVSGGAGVAMTTLTGTGATATNISNATSTSTNYDYASGNITQTGAVTVNSLRINGGAITTWANAGNGITLNGLMLAGTTNVAESGVGTITIGTGTNTELDIITNAQTLTLGSSIVNNGAGASKVVIGSSNGGVVVLSGSNSYTGGTIVNSGILRVANNSAVGDVLLNGGGTLNVDIIGVTLAGNITGTGKVTKSNSASSLTLNGNNTFSGGMTLTDGRLIMGTGSNNGIGTGTFTLSSGSLQSSDNSSRTISNSLSMGSNALGFGATQAALTGLGDLTFTSTASTVSVGGAKTWTVTNATTVTFANNWSGNAGFNVTKAGSGTLVFNGNLSNGASNVVVSAGTLALNGASSGYTGTTTISGGTLSVGANAPSGSAGALGNASSAVTLGDAATTTSNLSASLLTGGASTIGRAVTVANQATSGTYTIGGNTDNNSTFSGLITANQGFKVAQVATTSTNTLSITGGITGGNAGTKTVTFDSAGAVSVSGAAISDGSGTLAVTQSGAGTTTLSGTNNYTGATNINAGKLVVNGSISTSTLTTVNNNGTLGGAGTVGSVTVMSGGTVTPGNSLGILSAGDTDLQAASILALELGGTSAGVNYDRLNVTGSATLAGILSLTVTGTYANNDVLFLLVNDGADAINGTFSNYAEGASFTLGSQAWKLTYLANNTGLNAGSFIGGNDVALMAVPEPDAALLFGGLGMLALLRRRRA